MDILQEQLVKWKRREARMALWKFKAQSMKAKHVVFFYDYVANIEGKQSCVMYLLTQKVFVISNWNYVNNIQPSNAEYLLKA